MSAMRTRRSLDGAEQPTEFARGRLERRQGRTARLRVKAVAGALHAKDGHETARVVEDGDSDCGEILFALLVGLTPAARAHLIDGSSEFCWVNDRTRRERGQLGRNLGLRATTEGEDDLAHGCGVRNAGAPYEGR